jgi:phage host-nuclease inhibitor protein Gam
MDDKMSEVQMAESEQKWWSQELRYLRSSVDELKTEVGDIKNKVYNGYSENLQQLREITKDLTDAQKELTEIVHDHDTRLKVQEAEENQQTNDTVKTKLNRYRIATIAASVLGVAAVLLGVFL